MTIQKQKGPPGAMAFYNPNGFVPAFKHAMAFAGKEGRVATLPDIIEARLATEPGTVPWENYFTTMSAEYVGYSKGGNPIAIVAHGIGPMATLDGVLATYRHEFNDNTRSSRGGRISQEEFLRLESGHYGEVMVADINNVWDWRPYNFSNHPITAKEIEEEPLWQARLGPSWEAYVAHHTKFAHEYHKQQGHKSYTRPCILGMSDASNCSYSTPKLFEAWMGMTPGTAIAHLLSIGGLTNSHHQYYEFDYERRESRISLSSDIDCHEWWNGVRLLGIQTPSNLTIHPGLPKYHDLITTNRDKLWGPNPTGSTKETTGFWNLIKIGKDWFTEYPKQGERMDTGEPEFAVVGMTQVPSPHTMFRTTIGGYHGFVKYGINEVDRIKPLGANAYVTGDASIEYEDGNPKYHVMPVTFYSVQVDTTKRLVRMEDIYRDYDLMMSLVG